MKYVKKITSVISVMLLLTLFVFVMGMKINPDKTAAIVGYRFYTVLTDSMEPTVPTYSLVFSKMVKPDEPLQTGDIVTFKANRLGEDILLTHYFKEIETGKDGIPYYRTQGENAPSYDAYETKRSDIVGKYVFHIPYVGKLILFFQSPFSFVLYGEFLIIFFINKLIKLHWQEKEEEKIKISHI